MTCRNFAVNFQINLFFYQNLEKKDTKWMENHYILLGVLQFWIDKFLSFLKII